ncbi:MAG: carboxypeptidase-like regulatory domain-containing protein, partial [Candidatus Sulfotelmatobacter sp.]
MQGIKTRLLFQLLGSAVAALACSPICLFAAANGSLSGIVKDPSGAVIPAAKITLVNTAIRSEYTALSNGEGFYSFPALPVGHYDLTIEAAGFRTEGKSGLEIDTDSALALDAVLSLAQRTEAVTV